MISKTKDLMSCFNKHTQNLLQYLPKDHVNFEPARPSFYLAKDGPIKEGKIEKNQRAQTQTPISTTTTTLTPIPMNTITPITTITPTTTHATNYNVIMKPVEMGNKINMTIPIENKENKEIFHNTQTIITTHSVPQKYEPLTNIPTISLVNTSLQNNYNLHNLQPLSINTYTTNRMPDQLAPITPQYTLPNNYLTPTSYDHNTKYFRLTNPISPAKTPTHQQRIYGQQVQVQVPQSTYDYGNKQAQTRSPSKKVTVYNHHQHKPTAYVYDNIDKEADNIERAVRLSPATNGIIIDQNML